LHSILLIYHVFFSFFPSTGKRGRQIRTFFREFSVRLSFENQAWRDATPFLLFVSVEVGDLNGSDEVIYDFDRVSVMSVNFLLFVNQHFVYERSQDFGRQFLKVAVLVHERNDFYDLCRNGTLRPFIKYS